MKIIELSGYVGWDITAKKLREELPADNSAVLLKVDSFGGSVYEGNRLFNVIADYGGEIFVELGAVAASAASYFPLGVPVSHISVRENTTFMAHKAWTFMLGNSDELIAEARILNGFDKIIAGTYSKLTGLKTAEEYLEEMAGEIWLIGGQAVVDAGFASYVTEGSALPGKEENQIIDQMVIVAKVEEGKNKLKELGITEDLEKWAALVSEQLVENVQSVPLNADGNNLKGDFNYMEKLNEILDKNPDAKAEYLADLETAKAEGKKESVENEVKAERERVFKMINLSGNKLPDIVTDSIQSGETLENFMEKEITARNEKVKKPENNTDLGEFNTTGQTPESEEVEEGQTKMDAAIKRQLNKNGGSK